MRRFIVAGVCVLAGWPAYAEPLVLGDEALKQAVAGKTIHLDTPFGVAIPITYHGNGLMSGKAGVLEYFLGAHADRGRWWVANGRLCQKWFKWLDAQPSCMQLKQDGDKIAWRRDDGMSGTATIASALPPGAEAAPHGLGGPIQTPQLAQTLMATEPPESATPASIDLPPATLRRVPKAAAPKAVAAAAQPVLQPPPGGLDATSGFAAHGALSVVPEHPAGAEQNDRWCHAIHSAAVQADAVPELVFVARLPYVGSELPSPPNACLTAEPPLRHVAKMGIDVR